MLASLLNRMWVDSRTSFLTESLVGTAVKKSEYAIR